VIRTETYSHILKRWWWIVLVVFVVSLVTGFIITNREPRIYRAYTMMVVTPNYRVVGVNEIIRSLDTLDRRSVIATFAKIPTTRETFNAAEKGLQLEPGSLRGYGVSTSILPGTNIIRINVEGLDPKQAARLANAIASVSKHKAKSTYRIYKLAKFSEAIPSSHPIYPDPKRNLLVAGIVGLFLGIIVSFVVEYFRKPASGDTRLSGKMK
jgi:capsular polysaccharide biosynthesis protein